MLPLYCLKPCPTCGQVGQGTRAKPGNSVRCESCRTMRRVPHDRPMFGPDDPRASRPLRGRPLTAGNPYRFEPQRGTVPAVPEQVYEPAYFGPGKVRRELDGDLSTLRLRKDPNPNYGPLDDDEDETKTSAPDSIDPLVMLTERILAKARQRSEERHPRAQESAPIDTRTVTPRIYRPCETCQNEGIRNRNGTYPAAIVQVEVIANTARECVQAWLCKDHARMVRDEANSSEYGFRIIDRTPLNSPAPSPVSEPPRSAVRRRPRRR
jgi:hypothetical protein